jgi:hypothetical protein
METSLGNRQTHAIPQEKQLETDDEACATERERYRHTCLSCERARSKTPGWERLKLISIRKAQKKSEELSKKSGDRGRKFQGKHEVWQERWTRVVGIK